MTTTDIVFRHIRSTNGKVNLQALTREILQNNPESKWDQKHWGFYRASITSDKGRYANLFSEEIKRNLEETLDQRVERLHISSSTVQTQKSSTTRDSEKWPNWKTPSEEEQILLAKVLLPYIKILDPEIVALVAEDNNKNLPVWTEQFKKYGINPDIYLWGSSPVAFPGIRRHVGTTETANFRANPKLSKGENAFRLDDNSFPKEIWSFALRNIRYGMKNPDHYSLAHILDHKDYKTRNSDELIGFGCSEDKNLFAGLYTSCANAVYIPTSFLKPTDHNSRIRQLLIQIVDKYYGAVCKPLPHGLAFNLGGIEERWQLEKFPQPEIVGKTENNKSFLRYRNNLINEKLESYLDPL